MGVKLGRYVEGWT